MEVIGLARNWSTKWMRLLFWDRGSTKQVSSLLPPTLTHKQVGESSNGAGCAGGDIKPGTSTCTVQGNCSNTPAENEGGPIVVHCSAGKF